MKRYAHIKKARSATKINTHIKKARSAIKNNTHIKKARSATKNLLSTTSDKGGFE